MGGSERLRQSELPRSNHFVRLEAPVPEINVGPASAKRAFIERLDNDQCCALELRILILKQWNCELSTLCELAFGASFVWHHRGSGPWRMTKRQSI